MAGIAELENGLKAIISIPGMRNRKAMKYGRSTSKEDAAKAQTASVWVYRCAQIIGNSLAIMPWGLFEGDDELPKTHPAAQQMSFVNERENLVDSYRDIAMDLTAHGEGLWFKTVAGKILVRYQRLPAKEIERGRPYSKELPAETFVWTRGGLQSEVKRDDVAYFKNYGARESHDPDSPNKVGVDKAKSDHFIDQTVVSHFENYAIPPYVFTSDQSIHERDMDRYIGWWDNLLKNARRRWKASFMGGGLTPTRLRAPVKELELESLRKSIARDICAAAGVPPALAGAVETANRATWRQQLISMHHHTIIPMAQVIAGVINAEMVPFLFDEPEFRFLPEKVELLQEERSAKSERILNEVREGVIDREAGNKLLGYTKDMMGTLEVDHVASTVLKGISVMEQARELKAFKRKAVRSFDLGNLDLFDFHTNVLNRDRISYAVELVKGAENQQDLEDRLEII